jgi:hypothetical protein
VNDVGRHGSSSPRARAARAGPVRGRGRADRPEQLGACRSTLRGYLTALDGDALPPKRDRAEALGRLILDSWPFEVPLGQAILRAERAWRNA